MGNEILQPAEGRGGGSLVPPGVVPCGGGLDHGSGTGVHNVLFFCFLKMESDPPLGVNEQRYGPVPPAAPPSQGRPRQCDPNANPHSPGPGRSLCQNPPGSVNPAKMARNHQRVLVSPPPQLCGAFGAGDHIRPFLVGPPSVALRPHVCLRRG